MSTIVRRGPGRVRGAGRASARLRAGIVAVCVLALLLRVVLVLATPHYVPKTDSANYDAMAVHVVTQTGFPPSAFAPAGGPTALRPPAFPYLLAGVYELSGTGNRSGRWEAGRLAEAAIGAVIVALIMLIAARLWGARTGLVAGAIAAVYPPLVLIGSSLMSEPLYIALLLGAALCALRARDSGRPWAWALAAGLLTGASALTRGNGIVELLPVVILVWPRGRPWSRAALGAPVLAVVGCALALLPWTVRNFEAFGSFQPIGTEGGFALAGTYTPVAQDRTDYPALWVPPIPDLRIAFAAHPHANEAQISHAVEVMAEDYAKAHPASLARTAGWTALRLLNLTGTGLERAAAPGEAYPVWLAELSVYAFWAVGLLAVAGAFAAAARRAPRAIWAFPVLTFLSALFIIGVTRYRSPIDPFVIMLAALALLAPFEPGHGRRAAVGAPA